MPDELEMRLRLEAKYKELADPDELDRMARGANLRAIRRIEREAEIAAVFAERDALLAERDRLRDLAAVLEAETVRLRTDVVRAELAAVLKPDAVDAWLEDEIPALGGKRPVDLIPSDEGYELVRALIDAIAEGVFT